MLSRRAQSSCAAQRLERSASRSTSCSDPRAQYSITTHGGEAQTPRKLCGVGVGWVRVSVRGEWG